MLLVPSEIFIFSGYNRIFGHLVYRHNIERVYSPMNAVSLITDFNFHTKSFTTQYVFKNVYFCSSKIYCGMSQLKLIKSNSTFTFYVSLLFTK